MFFYSSLDIIFLPIFQVRLQPHGISFLRPVYLEMKDIKKSGQLILYRKEVDVHSHTLWNDITAICSPKFRKDDLVIALEHFSIVEAMKMLVPAAVGKNPKIRSIAVADTVSWAGVPIVRQRR